MRVEFVGDYILVPINIWQVKVTSNDKDGILVSLLQCCEFIFHLLQILFTGFVRGPVVRTKHHPLRVGDFQNSRNQLQVLAFVDIYHLQVVFGSNQDTAMGIFGTVPSVNCKTQALIEKVG